MAEAAIELVGINKSFGAVRANRDIHLSVPKGTIHGIIGENGAGKSTLMSILYGFYEADSGEIIVGGKKVAIRTPNDAIAHGIGMVHQHFMLVENFSVLENIILGAEGEALLNRSIAKARSELQRLERDYGLEVDPDAVIEELPVGLQQRVEILKALYRGADILILDEPTGVLTPAEADHLFRILRQLKDEGKTVVLITHKLREIMAVTDNVSVMRQGQMVATRRTAETSVEELAELMVGRRVLLRVEKGDARPGEVKLSVRGLTVKDGRGVVMIKDVSFDVRAGEIVGIAGVAGNGQSELLETISGIRKAVSGTVMLDGAPVDVSGATDPGDLRDRGLAHVPEDRHHVGLVLPFMEYENAILGYHDESQYVRGPFLDRDKILAGAAAGIEKYDIRPPNPYLKTANFSGGNQQKIVLAREMEQDPVVLIVGQPTRGVDVGAIEFIHRRLIDMRDQGKAVLLVSVELDEIRSLSDRILVMFDGRIVGERGPDATEGELGLLMAGVEEKKSAESHSASHVDNPRSAPPPDEPAAAQPDESQSAQKPDKSESGSQTEEKLLSAIEPQHADLSSSGQEESELPVVSTMLGGDVETAVPAKSKSTEIRIRDTEQNQGRVFISYRRSDTESITGRLYDRLVQEFGRDRIFMDIDNIPIGRDFRLEIRKALSNCAVVLAVVGSDWMGRKRGGFRINDDGDFLRLEIETALESEAEVIPVIVGRARMPDASILPEQIKQFSFLNGAQLDTGRDFHVHMDRIVEALKRRFEAAA